MAHVTPQTQAVLAALLHGVGELHYGLEIGRRQASRVARSIRSSPARADEVGPKSESEDVDPHEVGRRRRRYYRLTGEGEPLRSHRTDSTARRLQRASDQPGPSPAAGPA